MLRRALSASGRTGRPYARALTRTPLQPCSTSVIAGALSAAVALQTRSYCHTYEAIPIALPTHTPMPTPIHGIRRILAASPIYTANSMVGVLEALVRATGDSAHKAVVFISRAVRYSSRLVLYTLLGAPMLVLLPSARIFGDTCPPLERFSWGYMIWAIQTLGPCFIKLAQWASTRPDLFPPRLVERLVRLQDDVDVHHAPGTVERTYIH
jgi:hypothetical protein